MNEAAPRAARQATAIYIVTSDVPGNGKTLLARLLLDYLLLDEADPLGFDMRFPGGALRSYFPGRTTLVNFAQTQGRVKLFDTILSSPGRDHVIDLDALHLAAFCDMVESLEIAAEAHRLGLNLAVFFIVDRSAASLAALEHLEEQIRPDLMVPVANRATGSLLDRPGRAPRLVLPMIPPLTLPVIADRHFSIRAFLSGEMARFPGDQPLNAALIGVMKTLQTLRRGLPAREV